MASNVHDTFVKAVFSRGENAAGLLAEALPPRLLAALDLSSIECRPGRYAGVTSRETDLLHRVLLDGQEAFVYVLLEHKSTVDDPLLPATVFVYLGRILDEWLRANGARSPRERATKAPVVIPLVLYHGSDGWTAATDLLDVLDLDAELLAELRPHVPSYRLLVDDLVKRTDGDLRGRRTGVLGRIALLLLRHLRDLRHEPERLFAFLRTLADLFQLLPDEDRILSFEYILEVTEPDPHAVQSALRDVVSTEVLEGVMTAAERLRSEGKLEGKLEGTREGKLEGKRSLFLRLLRGRFGEVGAEVEAQVLAADEGTVEAWFDRALTAASVREVLTPARAAKRRSPAAKKRKR
jgi:hypothetical protein